MMSLRAIASLARQKWGVLLACVLIAWIASLPHGGLTAAILLPPMLIYQLIKATGRGKTEDVRRRHGFAAFAVAAAIAIVSAAQTYLHITSRAEADYVAAAIRDFKSKHNRYPKDLAELGDPRAIPRRELKLGYRSERGPSLFYAATYMPFAIWVFNFETNRWDGPVD